VSAPLAYPLRFSTDMLPERERFSALQEEFARRMLAKDLIYHGAGCPRMELTFIPLGPVAASTLASTPVGFSRQNHHLKDSTDDFHLDIVETGVIHFAQAGEECVYHPGSAYFIDRSRPAHGLGPYGGCVRGITVQAAALKTMVAHPEDLAGRPIRPGPALRLLDGYLQSLTSCNELPPPEMTQVVGGHLVDLLAAVLGPTAEAAEAVAKRGLKAARVREIRAEIARRCRDPGFDLDNVVRTLGLSRRYVQQLMQESGQSFTDHLAERRLELAFALLNDVNRRHRTITDVAFASGFNDVSHFNRMFRRRFGDTPSGVRAAAVRLAQE
jgi:AraC-like DNA-binding protein